MTVTQITGCAPSTDHQCEATPDPPASFSGTPSSADEPASQGVSSRSSARKFSVEDDPDQRPLGKNPSRLLDALVAVATLDCLAVGLKTPRLRISSLGLSSTL